MNRNIRNTLCMALGWSMLIGTAVLYAQDKKEPILPQVRVKKVTQDNVIQYQRVIGQTVATRLSQVASEQSGRVIQPPPDDGTTVKKGQIIAKLDDALLAIAQTDAQQRIEQAQANIAEAEAQMELANLNLQQIQKMAGQNAANLKEQLDAKAQQTAARARLKSAQIAVKIAQTHLEQIKIQREKTEIRAPFDGILTHRHTETGQWVNPGSTVATIISNRQIDAVLDVPEAVVARARKQTGPIQLNLHIEPLKIDRKATAYAVIPKADPQARTFPVKMRIDNADRQILPGMSVSAMLPTDRKQQALLVPTDAVQDTPAGPRVYVVRAGRAVLEPVRILFKTDQHYIVEADLEPGESVIVEGNEKLQPNTQIKIVQ